MKTIFALIALAFSACSSIPENLLSTTSSGTPAPAQSLGFYIAHFDGTTVSAEARDSLYFQFDNADVMISKADMQDALNRGFDFASLLNKKQGAKFVSAPMAGIFLNNGGTILASGTPK